MKKLRETVLASLRNCPEYAEKNARDYLLSVEPAWMHNHLANAVSRLLAEAAGQIGEEDRISDRLFL